MEAQKPQPPPERTEVDTAEGAPLPSALGAAGDLTTSMAWAFVCAVTEPGADHPAIAAVNEAIEDALEAFTGWAEALRDLARDIDAAAATNDSKETPDGPADQ